MKFLQTYLSTLLIVLIHSFSVFAQIETVKGPDDGFGLSLAIDGDYMIVGAPWEPIDYLFGAVHIYKFNGSNWGLQNSFVLDDQTQNDRFGHTVDISGDYAIANVFYWDDESIPDCGTAWIFKRSGETWEMQQQLLSSDREEEDFGTAVAIEGDIAMLASHAEDTRAVHAGAVYVFKRNENSWDETQKLMASDGVNSAFFGRVVDIDGNFALISASNDNNGRGAVYVFKYESGSWTQQQKLVASDAQDGAQFGKSADIHGNYAVISAWKDDEIAEDAGAAYIFYNDDGTWVEQKKITLPNGKASQYFGSSVCLYKNRVLISSPEVDTCYAYLLNEDQWKQVAKVHHFGASKNGYRALAMDEDRAFWGLPEDSSIVSYSRVHDLNMAPPELDNIPDQLINQGSSFLQISLDDYVEDLNDSDTDIIWNISGANDLQVTITDRVATIIPVSIEWYGSETILFKAKDRVNLTGWDEVTFTVNAVPQISGLPASVNFPANRADTLNIWDYVQDADNGDAELTYIFTPSTSSLHAAYDDATGELILTADPTYTGTCSLDIEIKDYNEATAQDIFNVTVDPPVSINESADKFPARFALSQNYPNPFNPVTSIKYQLAKQSHVELTIYNLIGEKVRTLVGGTQEAGAYSVKFNGALLPAGLYFYKISAGEFKAVRKMILVK